VGGVAGDDGAVQVYRAQQFPDLGDLVGVLGDGVLGDDHLLLVQHRGEQLDLLPVADAAQPFPADRDRAQQVLQPPGVRQFAQPAPVSASSLAASISWSTVRIRFSLGAMIVRSSGCGLPPSRASTSCGRSVAWSPVSRKFLAPASTHATATASRNTSVYRRPRLRRGSGTCPSTSSKPGSSSSVLVTVVTVVTWACGTGMDGLASGPGRELNLELY
jgi:hypothetical protein